jgi:membrane protease YdiL (CAAX protease family)
MSNVRSEIWNTFWQFSLSLLLFNTPAFVGFSNYDTFAWSVVVCSLILIIFFLGRRYVSLSPGLIERKNIWRLMGLIVLTVVANIFFELSILDLPFYHNIFPEEWAELLEDDMQMTLPLYLDACLLAPIAEEIAFRGVFLGGLLRMQCNPWLAILISTIIFSIMHMSPMMFLNVTIAGFIFGWLFWRTKSLVPGIIAHITCNTIASLCGPVIEYFTNPIQEEYAPNVVLDVIVIIIAIPMLFFALQRINKMMPKSINIESITPDCRRVRDDLHINGYDNFDYEQERLKEKLK